MPVSSPIIKDENGNLLQEQQQGWRETSHIQSQFDDLKGEAETTIMAQTSFQSS